MATATDTQTQDTETILLPVSQFGFQPTNNESSLVVVPVKVSDKGAYYFEVEVTPDGFVVNHDVALYLITHNKNYVRYWDLFQSPGLVAQFIENSKDAVSFQKIEIIKNLANDPRQRPSLGSVPSIIEFVKDTLYQASLTSTGWKIDEAIEKLSGIFEFDEDEAKTLVATMCVNDLARTPGKNVNLKDLTPMARAEYRLFVLDNFGKLDDNQKTQFLTNVLAEYALSTANSTTSIIKFVEKLAKSLLDIDEVKQLIASASKDICKAIMLSAKSQQTSKITKRLENLGIADAMIETANELFEQNIKQTNQNILVSTALPFANPDRVLEATKLQLLTFRDLENNHDFKMGLIGLAGMVGSVLTSSSLSLKQSKDLLDAVSTMPFKQKALVNRKSFVNQLLIKLSNLRDAGVIKSEVREHLLALFSKKHLTNMIDWKLLTPDEAPAIIAKLVPNHNGLDLEDVERVLRILTDPTKLGDEAYDNILEALIATRTQKRYAIEAIAVSGAVDLGGR